MLIDDTQIDAVLREVEQELAKALADDMARLSKAAPDDEPVPASPADSQSPTSASPNPSPDASVGTDGTTDASADAPPSVSDASPDSAPPGGDAPPGDDAGQHPDMESLVAEFSKLPPDELKVYYMAAKTALFQSMQGGGDAPASPPPDAAAPPAGPPPSPSPSPSPSAPPMGKGEMSATKGKVVPPSPGSGGLAKSEAKIAELEGQLSLLTKAVEMAIGAPQRKAITSIAHLSKGEDSSAPKHANLTRDQINAKLREKARTELAKSDRTLINSYAMGNLDASKIEHLLS